MLAAGAAGWCCAKGRLWDFTQRLFGRIGAGLAQRRAGRPLRGSVRVSVHELRKAFWTSRAWIYPAVAVLVTVYLWDVRPLRLGSAEDAAYKVYANYWSGALTPEKQDEIEAESRYIESIPERIRMLGGARRRGELSDEEYRARYYELSGYAESRQKGFQSFYKQYTQTLILPAGVVPGIVDRISADYWFDHETRDLLRGLGCVLLCVLSCSRIFPLDDERGLVPLLRAAPRGRGRRISGKLLSALLLTLLVWCGLYAAPFATLIGKYRLAGNCGVQNLTLTLNHGLEFTYRTLGWRVSVGGYIALVSALQLAAACAVSVWTLLISRAAKKAGTAVLISAVLFGAPFLLKLAGLDFVTAFSPAAAFTAYQALPGMGRAAAGYAAGVTAVLGAGVALLYREGGRK